MRRWRFGSCQSRAESSTTRPARNNTQAAAQRWQRESELGCWSHLDLTGIEQGYPVLNQAAYNGHLEIVIYLLKMGADLEGRSKVKSLQALKR